MRLDEYYVLDEISPTMKHDKMPYYPSDLFYTSYRRILVKKAWSSENWKAFFQRHLVTKTIFTLMK